MNLKMLITIIWDGDVTHDEAIEGFKDSEVACMDLFCRLNPTVLQDGIPLPGEDEIWDMIAVGEEAGRLITKMISKFEEVETWPVSPIQKKIDDLNKYRYRPDV